MPAILKPIVLRFFTPFVALLCVLLAGTHGRAQTPPVQAPTPTLPPVFTLPCQSFPNDFSPEATLPWAHPDLPCMETIADDARAGELAFVGLATDLAGRLFVSRPVTGEVLLMADSDGEGAPDNPQVIIAGLDQPRQMVYADDSLYIRGASAVYRWTPGTPADIETLIDGLPAGAGFIGGGLAVTDEAVYVGVGAPCVACPFDDPRRGVVLHYDRLADGTLAAEPVIFAAGLRDPQAMTVFDGGLWIADAAFDAVYRVPLDAVDVRPQPTFMLPSGSAPTALIWYTGDGIPALTGRLLVVLGGRVTAVDLPGFALIALDLAGGTSTTLLPANSDPAFTFSTRELNFRGSGFYPHRPLAMTVDTAGWLYLSVGGGRVLLVRPHIAQALYFDADAQAETPGQGD